ncbi:NAD(P)H-quinone oxidoreductase [Bacillus sp. AFS017336]|uniref:NAD(P)H-quinone oxidoreductase n=1 Tax=Bacillus sp. AFS017336 TaxID=2033489 RepID=UPI000BF050C5|nr:NAD(P)H-quinone oxidoreductase [Bacillus sp. AFS017336]PEL13276.1 NADPH:quinone oxidoreductase [Bacillus sp. AFS017336]
MKAVQIDEAKQLFIDDYPMPALGENELLVKVHATAINRADLLQKHGKYAVPPGASPILGLEMSGIVEQIGPNVTNWNIGDRVCGLLPGGGYAQYVSIPADLVIPIPDHLSFEDAAAIPEVFLTAYLNLFELGKLKENETVLIHAGASGVGTAAIQLARELGAKSIVTAGNESKLAACTDLGANYVVNYKNEDFKTKVEEITVHAGVDVILDFIGASYFHQNLQSLTTNGRLILIGTMGGIKVNDVNLLPLLTKRISIIGSTLRSQTLEQKIHLTNQFKKFVLPLFTNNKIKPIIDSVYSWHEVNEAHSRMENNLNIGKIVLKID